LTSDFNIKWLQEECRRKVAEIRAEYQGRIDLAIKNRREKCEHQWVSEGWYEERRVSRCSICEEVKFEEFGTYPKTGTIL